VRTDNNQPLRHDDIFVVLVKRRRASVRERIYVAGVDDEMKMTRSRVQVVDAR
jgi:hypothetical protein